jgi:hypothetical protein
MGPRQVMQCISEFVLFEFVSSYMLLATEYTDLGA